ncbi:DUF1540 domain-containing protein [Lachnospiraceae bacterium JLR.KK008]
MAQLDCRAENCVYNKNQSCCKGDIMIGGKHADRKDDTCCESFSARRAENSYVSALEHPCRTISIDCEACNCMYNTNYKCHAEHVDIAGQGACDCHQTACGTFKEDQQ